MPTSNVPSSCSVTRTVNISTTVNKGGVIGISRPGVRMMTGAARRVPSNPRRAIMMRSPRQQRNCHSATEQSGLPIIGAAAIVSNDIGEHP